MNTTAQMVYKDPESFHLLTLDMKEKIIKGAIAQVNIEAAMTRKRAQANIRDNFTLRNTFTEKQVQFTQMPQGRYALAAIHSTVGATEKASYMLRQEEGGKHEPPSGGFLGIATNVARGGNKAALVQKKFRLSEIRNVKVAGDYSRGGGTHKSRLVARAAVAAATGKLIHVNGPNLFAVDSFRAKGGEVSFRTREVYNFERTYTDTTAQPWLRPAADEVAKQGENIFISQMKKLGM